jgi:hypothetical protein
MPMAYKCCAPPQWVEAIYGWAPTTPIGTRFGKELTHPIYDHVKLKPEFDASLKTDA